MTNVNELLLSPRVVTGRNSVQEKIVEVKVDPMSKVKVKCSNYYITKDRGSLVRDNSDILTILEGLISTSSSSDVKYFSM